MNIIWKDFRTLPEPEGYTATVWAIDLANIRHFQTEKQEKYIIFGLLVALKKNERNNCDSSSLHSTYQ